MWSYQAYSYQAGLPARAVIRRVFSPKNFLLFRLRPVELSGTLFSYQAPYEISQLSLFAQYFPISTNTLIDISSNKCMRYKEAEFSHIIWPIYHFEIEVLRNSPLVLLLGRSVIG